MVLKGVPSNGTRVEVEGLWQEKAILDFEVQNVRIVLQMKLLRSDSRLGSLIILSDMIHTRGESLQDGLEDIQTCGITLASAYMLCYLSTM